MKLTTLALDNARFTAIILGLVTLLGAASLWTMPRPEDPQFETATVRIAAVYPGASPQDVESLVVDPIEDEVDQRENVDQIESTIQSGGAVTSVEFPSTVSADDAEAEVQRAVSQVEGDLPDGVRDLPIRAKVSERVLRWAEGRASHARKRSSCISSRTANSTLLVDYANQLRANGHSLLDAAMEAGQTRFAPILLTAITMIGGVLPPTLSGSSLWGPLGWVLIGGLLAATLLTLIVVPVLYTLLTTEHATG